MNEKTGMDEINVKAVNAELVNRLSRAITADGSVEVFPGFVLNRRSTPTESSRGVYEPAFCFVAQGTKEAQLGDEIFTFDPQHYMIYTVDLPLIFRIANASAERPYVGFSLRLDPAVVASVMIESGIRIKNENGSARAMDVNAVGSELLDAVVRLVRLVDDKAGRKVLAPMITREIIYRLLAGGEGARLASRRASRAGAHPHARADRALRRAARLLGTSPLGADSKASRATGWSTSSACRKRRPRSSPSEPG